ncbi:hypothetical protein ACI79J_05105 [Geodermatophilus sp. SYSU D01062]
MPLTVVLQLVALLGVAVAVVDALRGSDGDLLLLLGAVALVQLAALAARARGRSAVALRPDLAGWLHQQAAATGEPVERLADRCVAAYRAGLTGTPAERS